MSLLFDAAAPSHHASVQFVAIGRGVSVAEFAIERVDVNHQPLLVDPVAERVECDIARSVLFAHARNRNACASR